MKTQMNKKSQNKSKILLIEDEESLAVGLRYNLSEEGYDVEWVTDGNQALEAVREKEYDLLILDVMLPYLDGFEVSKNIRLKYPKIPILMLTARTRVEDKIEGLESGADDYITKPFNLEELLLRLKGMLKRKAWYQEVISEQPLYTFGKNEINFENLQCKNEHEEFRLTPREAMVLKYLVDHKGKIVSRKELLENVWGISSEIETRTVDNFIVRLRKYFEKDAANPKYIKSIRSAGYQFIS
jgi:two-component system alkaline phosphatase synthesis response regulator PhoP